MFYVINSGAPCAIGTPRMGTTIKNAKLAFAWYLADCKRFGNDFSNATLEISGGERLFKAGPRGGIVEVQQ